MMMLKILMATTAMVSAPVLAQTAPAGSPPASNQAATQASATMQGGTAGPAGAATAGSGVAQGATIYDTQGGTVGRIESVSGDMVVVATQKNKVQLPKSSFASGPKGPVIAMTAAQLDQAASQAAPAAGTGGTTGGSAAKANVVQGAAVSDTQGGSVGTVTEADAQFATVTLTTGSKVRLPVSAFGAGANGGLRVAMTAAQLSAAGAASGGGTSTSTDTSAAAGDKGGKPKR